MTYVRISDEGAIAGVIPRPAWFDGEDGHPLSDAELEQHGIFAVADADPVAEGKISVGATIHMVAGRPKYIHTLADAPPPSSSDVDAERDRRIVAGFTFGGKLYQSRPEDRENIAGASVAALAAIVAGAEPGDLRWHGGGSDFVWIAADNSLTPMDAQTMFAFGQAAMAHKQAMIFAGRALKDAVPIPADYFDDGYWPGEEE